MRVIKAALVALVLSVGLAAPVGAGPLEDGVAAYVRGDYETAYRLWRPLADQGNATARHNLGILYEDGEGVPQDYVQAHMWSDLAASASTGRRRDEAVELRARIAAKMTPAQIAEAQKLAGEWRPASER